MTSEDIKEALIEYAEEEAGEIARCLFTYRQKHCIACEFRGFCDKLLKKLREQEEEAAR